MIHSRITSTRYSVLSENDVMHVKEYKLSDDAVLKIQYNDEGVYQVSIDTIDLLVDLANECRLLEQCLMNAIIDLNERGELSSRIRNQIFEKAKEIYRKETKWL